MGATFSTSPGLDDGWSMAALGMVLYIPGFLAAMVYGWFVQGSCCIPNERDDPLVVDMTITTAINPDSVGGQLFHAVGIFGGNLALTGWFIEGRETTVAVLGVMLGVYAVGGFVVALVHRFAPDSKVYIFCTTTTDSKVQADFDAGRDESKARTRENREIASGPYFEVNSIYGRLEIRIVEACLFFLAQAAMMGIAVYTLLTDDAYDVDAMSDEKCAPPPPFPTPPQLHHNPAHHACAYDQDEPLL